MVSQVLTNWIIFVVIFIVFLPFTSKTIRLASRTWDERENLPEDYVKKVVYIVPSALIIGFAIFYAVVLFLINTIVF